MFQSRPHRHCRLQCPGDCKIEPVATVLPFSCRNKLQPTCLKYQPLLLMSFCLDSLRLLVTVLADICRQCLKAMYLLFLTFQILSITLPDLACCWQFAAGCRDITHTVFLRAAILFFILETGSFCRRRERSKGILLAP